ncbi:helix-turn-helix domain-containing protein [Aeromonas diversa]|uniref:helix-turn-helix domain-containing protein n=1 Tax=Aeromonas diversa TaxID=502790 RepID=UPI00399F1FF1
MKQTSRHRKEYLSLRELEYVEFAKRRLNAILSERDINSSALSAMTGIPVSSLSRWLSHEKQEFMSLADAALICRTLGIDLQQMLPPATWPCSDSETHHILVVLMGIPYPKLQWLYSLYLQATKVFAK